MEKKIIRPIKLHDDWCSKYKRCHCSYKAHNDLFDQWQDYHDYIVHLLSGGMDNMNEEINKLRLRLKKAEDK